MKVFSTVALLVAFLVLVAMPAKILAGDHEVFDQCRAHCQETCATRLARPFPCPLICVPGQICEEGYVRETANGPCIPTVECPLFLR